ncbi:MAG: nitroreductase family protein [Lachnospiraceae bacterium]|jgi:nitroreductase
MQDILEVLKTRRSIRKYQDKPVPDELLEKIIEAGLYAPTGMNRQDAIILEITDPETLRTLGLINGKIMGQDNFDGFYGAPALLCVLAEKDSPIAVYDGCSVISNMINEAASLGLGSCWIHRCKEQFETPEGKEILKKAGIDPDKYVGIDNVAVGYTDGELPAAPARKSGRVFKIN